MPRLTAQRLYELSLLALVVGTGRRPVAVATAAGTADVVRYLDPHPVKLPSGFSEWSIAATGFHRPTVLTVLRRILPQASASLR